MTPNVSHDETRDVEIGGQKYAIRLTVGLDEVYAVVVGNHKLSWFTPLFYGPGPGVPISEAKEEAFRELVREITEMVE